jgi:endonuclease YncB( thermonuclease family)
MIRAALLTLASAGCTSAPTSAQAVGSLYWSDGDSGRVDGVPFRLADVDAPETGGAGARGGAKCEAERVLGFKAKEFIVKLTRGREVTIANAEELDDFGRRVMSLSVDGEDIGQIGVLSGHLRPYAFDGRKKTMDKPDWCS